MLRWLCVQATPGKPADAVPYFGDFFGERLYRRSYWEGRVKVRKNIKSYEGRKCTKLVVCTVANDVLTVVSKKNNNFSRVS